MGEAVKEPRGRQGRAPESPGGVLEGELPPRPFVERKDSRGKETDGAFGQHRQADGEVGGQQSLAGIEGESHGGEEDEERIGQEKAEPPCEKEHRGQGHARPEPGSRAVQGPAQEDRGQAGEDAEERGGKACGEFVDAEGLVAQARRPIEEDGFFQERPAFQRGDEPFAVLLHLQGRLGVLRLVPVPERGFSQAREEDGGGKKRDPERPHSFSTHVLDFFADQPPRMMPKIPPTITSVRK